MPEISIIVPIYNAENYIATTLDSLVRQTFSDIEILCINNGSTDKSQDILNRYADKYPQIKVIFLKENIKPTGARHKGLTESSGKWIMFCDSDDWYEPDMCEKMIKAVSDADMACANAFITDEREDLQRIDHNSYYRNKLNGKYEINDAVILKTNVPLWNKIFKKDLIDTYHISFPEGHENDDDCFIFQYMTVAKSISFIDTPLYHYIRRQQSISGLSARDHQKAKNLYDRLYIMRYYADWLKRNHLWAENKILFSRLFVQEVESETYRWKEDKWQSAKQVFEKLFTERPLSSFFPIEKKCCSWIIRYHNAIKKSKIRKRITLLRKGKKVISFTFKTKQTLFH